jgi:predicted CoA-binding protein
MILNAGGEGHGIAVAMDCCMMAEHRQLPGKGQRSERGI